MESDTFGCGMNGKVVRGRGVSDGRRYAIKRLVKASMSPTALALAQREVDIHLQLHHPHIVRLERVYETDKSWHLVMEALEGGDLLSIVIERGRFTEDEAVRALRQMLSAVAHLHAGNIAHRDIKLEHFLYCQRDASHLKLIDFGFAERWEAGLKMTTSCGTLHYSSPEVMAGAYTEKADMWSMGICAYAILCGTLPFEGSSDEVERSIRTGRLRYSRTRFHCLSPSAQDFVKSLLAFAQDERSSASDALAHPWLCSSGLPLPGRDDAFVRDANKRCAIRLDDLAAAKKSTCCIDPCDVETLFRNFDATDRGEVGHADILAHPLCESADPVQLVFQRFDAPDDGADVHFEWDRSVTGLPL